MLFSGSIVALVTPFNEGRLDLHALSRLIDFHILSGTRALVVCGSTGEGNLLSSEERTEVILTALKEADERIPVIVACGTPSTWQTLEQVALAERLQASAALVVAPYYSKPSEKGLFEHYEHIHAKTSLPLLLYNNPSRCAVDMSTELIGALSKLERIVGLKDSNTDLSRVTQIRRLVGEDFSLLSGDDPTLAGYLAHGGDGVISIAANIVPSWYRELIQAWHTSDLETFRDLNQKLMPLALAMCEETNPTPIKCALSLISKCHNEVRLPLRKASQRLEGKLKVLLKEFGYWEIV